MKVPGDKKQGAPLGGAPEAMMNSNEAVSYFRMLTAPKMTAGGVTETIVVTGATTIGTTGTTGASGVSGTTGIAGVKAVTGTTTVAGATGSASVAGAVAGTTDPAGANGVPWAADVPWGTVVPFGLDVVLLAVTAGVAGSTGVASTGMWETRTVSLAISSRGTSLRAVPSIAFVALARMAAC